MTQAPNPRLAIVLMLTATSFIAGTTLAAKALGTDSLGPALHPLQVTHGRFLFAFLALGLAALVIRPNLGRPNLTLHVQRSLCGFVGVTLMFAAAAQMRLSDATAISFLNPVFGMLLAIPLLGEKVGPWRWTAAGLAFLGALILLRPGPDTFQVAALLALGAAAMLGLELIFIKRLAGREPAFQILLTNNAIGLIVATLAVVPFWHVATLQQWGALVALGCMMAAAQTCFVNAMARADASFVTPFSYLTLVFAALYDAVLFGIIPDRVSYAGAAIILAGAALLAWREGRIREK